MSAPSHRDYRAFGMRIRSALELPELFVATGEGDPDVVIETGEIGAAASEAELLPIEDGSLLTIPEVARFLISAGRTIRVDAVEGVDPRNVRLFLLGSAFGVLLHQRGLLPLHANAIEIDGQAVAFMGPSGAGKSTLAGFFHDRGFRVIADDVCVVGFDEDAIPQALPGLPRLRLWGEALELMGRNPQDFVRSYLSDEREKFDVPINAASAAQLPMPIAGIYLLDRGADFCVERLHGLEAAEAVFANTYRGSYLPSTKGQKAHWEAAVKLVSERPIYRAVREWDVTALDQQCARLVEHARALPRR